MAPAGVRTDAPLRVGFLARAYPPHRASGGIGHHTQLLAHALGELGHEIHVFTERAERLRREGSVHVHGVETEVLPLVARLPATDRTLRWASAVTGRIVELARDGVALDLVEAANWDSEAAVVRRSGLVPVVVRLVSPLVVTAETEGRPLTDDLRAAIALERWLVATADGVISSTAVALANISERMGLPPLARMVCIPFGVPPGSPEPPPARGRRVLFVGRLERRKGIETLLAAVPRLLAADPDLHVDLVGDDTLAPPGEPTFRQRFLDRHEGAPWQRRCRFHGVVSDAALERFYRDCTVLVAPSLYESFGLIYLEAMRFGKPVIGCPVGGVPEVVDDGVTGLLVPPGDAEALAAAVARVVGDPALAARLGAAGRHAVATRFSARTMAERTAAFYRKVLADHSSRLDRLREEPIDLDDPTRVRFLGPWETRVADDGDRYRVACSPESAVEVTVPPARAVGFHLLGHPRAGVASLTVGTRGTYLDLFRRRREDRLRWAIPGTRDAHGPWRLALAADVNPDARGHELWLRRITLTP